MDTQAYKLARATLRMAVRDYGWHRTHGGDDCYRAPLGKFESEHWSIVHWHDAVMNGDGESFECWEVFEPDVIECEAFGIAPGNVVALHYSESGFVSMRELTQCELGRLREDYATDDSNNQQE